ncbi:hypothetical protein SEA_ROSAASANTEWAA_46 [Streptomyces phage RosaAsantewaa]|nr:hypothetical protein SEA_ROSAASANTEWAA_46 [Streptomyces phage RosaAsantewaa]
MKKIETKTYARKSFTVDAVQVTEENIRDVATWCGGTVAKKLDDTGRLYIKLERVNVSYKRRTMAFVGDWVLVSSTGFKIYENKSFKGVFEPIDLTASQKFSKVHALVMDAMRRQDAETYNDTSSNATPYGEEIAKRIMEVFS